MSETPDATAARRGTLYLLLLSICGVVLATWLLVAGLSDLRAGRWFGSDGGFGSAIAGAFLGFAALRCVGLWRGARRPSTRSVGASGERR